MKPNILILLAAAGAAYYFLFNSSDATAAETLKEANKVTTGASGAGVNPPSTGTPKTSVSPGGGSGVSATVDPLADPILVMRKIALTLSSKLGKTSGTVDEWNWALAQYIGTQPAPEDYLDGHDRTGVYSVNEYLAMRTAADPSFNQTLRDSRKELGLAGGLGVFFNPRMVN